MTERKLVLPARCAADIEWLAKHMTDDGVLEKEPLEDAAYYLRRVEAMQAVVEEARTIAGRGDSSHLAEALAALDAIE